MPFQIRCYIYPKGEPKSYLSWAPSTVGNCLSSIKHQKIVENGATDDTSALSFLSFFK